MSTSFSCLRDGAGKPLKIDAIEKMHRLRKYDNHSKVNDTQARNLSIAMGELSKLNCNSSSRERKEQCCAPIQEGTR